MDDCNQEATLRVRCVQAPSITVVGPIVTEKLTHPAKKKKKKKLKKVTGL